MSFADIMRFVKDNNFITFVGFGNENVQVAFECFGGQKITLGEALNSSNKPRIDFNMAPL